MMSTKIQVTESIKVGCIASTKFLYVKTFNKPPTLPLYLQRVVLKWYFAILRMKLNAICKRSLKRNILLISLPTKVKHAYDALRGLSANAELLKANRKSPKSGSKTWLGGFTNKPACLSHTTSAVVSFELLFKKHSVWVSLVYLV